MKKRINYLTIILTLFFLNVSSLIASEPKLEQISQKLTQFLKEKENWPWEVDSLAMSLIINEKEDKNLLQCREGIFKIITISTATYTHYLLLSKDSAEIINMREPMENNIRKLLDFFTRNQNYSREDILFSLDEMLKTDDYNKREYKNHLNSKTIK